MASRSEAGVGAAAAAVLQEVWTGWLVAFSLSGFYLYLGALALVGSEPRTEVTGAYYALLGVLLGAGVWHGRGTLGARIRRADGVAWAFAAAAVLLASWFLLNVALLAGHALAWRLAALLVLSSLPTALLAASLEMERLRHVAHGLVALGVAFAAIQAGVAILGRDDEVFRFSPIEWLDPISAGLIPALAALAVLVLRPATRARLVLAALVFVVLTASTVVSGSRAPVLALVVGAVAVAAVPRGPRLGLVTLPCLVAGIALGALAATQLGSFGYLVSDLPELVGEGTAPRAAADDPRVSTAAIRRQWLAKALAAAPERPLLGHGVATLVDDTPEAEAMGIAGRRVYPHNTLVEAAYSLGLLGLVPFVVLLATGAWAFARVVRRRRDPPALLLVVLAAFAAVNTNVSGEIGADRALWTALALAVALYLEGRSLRRGA